MKLTGNSRRDYPKLTAENLRLKDLHAQDQERITSLLNTITTLRQSRQEMECKYKEQLAEKDAIIRELKVRLANAEARLNHDGTNTGTPTSQTRLDKRKIIPNSRRSTGRKKGGQPCHPKHELPPPQDNSITDIVEHDMPVSCPDCGSIDFSSTGRSKVKYEYDVKVSVAKIKHVFHYYRCSECGRMFRSLNEPHLKGRVQYGAGLQAILLSLCNYGNMAFNKVVGAVTGFTNDEITPSEGFVAKLQKRAAVGLQDFVRDLRTLLLKSDLIYWDDTVISVNTHRACLRFYGDDRIAYYTAHEHKDMQSLETDNILPLLPPECTVMHDHNTVNYNAKFVFANIECNQHLQRDLQKNSDDTRHSWSTELKALISATIGARKEAIAAEKASFDADVVAEFDTQLSRLIKQGWEQQAADKHCYGADFEAALLRRLEKYRDNYFLWVRNFKLPTTNNVSERGLRGVKTKLKVSGQFQSISAAQNYSKIRSYIETCRRNNINENQALRRLCEGKPYTVAEIFQHSPSG